MEDSGGEVALWCEGLVKRYGTLTAVGGVDLRVRRGECFGMLGPNGAGKTTTIEILEGLTQADAGQVEVLGRRWRGAEAQEIRERLGISLQEAELGDKLTVAEVLRLYRSFYRKGRSTEELIELFELTSKRNSRYHTLSGGQKQRLSVAVALVGNPEILFLDEPTTGLDPQARLSLWNVIEACVKAGVTVVLTTHYMEEAARLCNRVAIFDQGKVIALGTPEELIASLGADQVIEIALSAEIDLAVFRNLPGVIGALRRLDRYMLNVEDVQRALPAVLRVAEAHGAELTHAAIHRATLDDVFIHLTGRGLRDA